MGKSSVQLLNKKGPLIPMYSSTGTNGESLFKIIPTKLDSISNDFANVLIELFEKCQVHYDYIKSNFKVMS